MSENSEITGNKFEGMRTSLIGMAGTLTALTLKEWSDLAAACAGFATALYMIFKCVDWAVVKIIARRFKKRKNRRHETD